MSNHTQQFIENLIDLKFKQDRRALAILKRSLGFKPGYYPPAYPYVEPFISADKEVWDPYRQALYLIAGLYALYPHHSDACTFASAFGSIAKERKMKTDSESLEKRFVALLSTEIESLTTYLRQAISLIGSEEKGINFIQLIKDVSRWSGDYNVKQNWARDFYRNYNPAKE